MVSTSTTFFRLCKATRRYFLLSDGICVLPANEEDESKLSALIVEPLDMHWAKFEKDTTNLWERMHNNTYQCTRTEGKACMQCI